MDKFQILSKILRDLYKNKVDDTITLKILIDLLDEVEEKYEKGVWNGDKEIN